MTDLSDKEMHDEINNLALYLSNRELDPAAVIAMCAAAVGEIVGRNRHADLISDHAARAMIDSATRNMTKVAFTDRSSDGASNVH